MLAYFLETTALDGTGATHPILLTSGLGYGDPSGPGFFDPRIMGEDDTSAGLSVSRTVFDNGALGAGSVTYGTLTAANPDGGLASWLTWGFSTATLKLGDDAGPYSGLTTVLTAPTTQATAQDTSMTLSWTSRMVELSLPACPATFAGTNSGTAGLEGTASDIMGQNKPWATGRLFNIKPVVLNSSTRILGWNFNTDGTRRATFSVDKIKYGGAQWTPLMSAGTNGDFATSDALIAYVTASNLQSGSYVTCLAESLVAMGGSASLTSVVTLDVTIESVAANRYAGTLWQRALQRAGVPLSSISTADVAALNAVAPFEVGYYATGSTTFQAIADAFASSVAACYVPDRLNVYRIYQMKSPAGTPLASFKRLTLDQVQGPTDGDLLTVTPVSGGSDWVPVKTVRCTYAHNWTVLSSGDIAAAVATADATALTLEWQYTPYSTSAPAAAMYANATQQDFTTYLAVAADAHAIADVLLALYSAQRREYQATVTFGTQFGSLVDLGSIVAVSHPKYGWADTPVAVHGIRLRENAGLAELKLWL